ncbi:MAG TPA: radical SAM protein [Bacteroidetes bacterium]|nr:radical SAM protein [Bacteroidota bacterium]
MADILLTHSYFLKFDPKEHRAMMPYPPLGTLYAAAYLRKQGLSVAFHDVLLTETEEAIKLALAEHQPRIVVIYDDQFNYLTKMCLGRMREAAFKITQLSKRQGCTVVVFSSDSTDHLNEYFTHGADHIVIGEAEISLGQLSRSILAGSCQSPDTIDGIAFVRNGQIVQTARRALIEHLDSLPLPAWDLVDFDSYRKRWMSRHGFYSLNMVTTRGCPFHCNWCAKPIYGQVYHSRSPENVVEEMKHLRRLAHPDHLWFTDDIFGLQPRWIAKFDEVVNHEGAKIPFKCLSRADLLLREENIEHLRSAGCQTVWMGAESGSQKILDAMEKGTTVEQIYKATGLLRAAGIRVGFFLQYGYPGERKNDIEQTLHMVKECRPDEIGISVSYPLPGTKFFNLVKEELKRKQNWVHSGDLDVMFRGTYAPDFYRALHTVTHKKFRIWQGRNSLIEALRRPSTIDRSAVSSIARSAYHALTLPPLEFRLWNLSREVNPPVGKNPPSMTGRR